MEKTASSNSFRYRKCPENICLLNNLYTCKRMNNVYSHRILKAHENVDTQQNRLTHTCFIPWSDFTWYLWRVFASLKFHFRWRLIGSPNRVYHSKHQKNPHPLSFFFSLLQKFKLVLLSKESEMDIQLQNFSLFKTLNETGVVLSQYLYFFHISLLVMLWFVWYYFT